MGGGTQSRHRAMGPWRGLSPHGRGNRLAAAPFPPAPGPIPAWAGEPSPTRGSDLTIGAYPRMGGGTQSGVVVRAFHSGLSPHGRGNHVHCLSPQDFVGPIPAWAGEPTAFSCASMAARAYPRMGGGTRISSRSLGSLLGLSPHGRGNRRESSRSQPRLGPIPAWAGEPGPAGAGWAAKGAYPRMGGGTPDDAATTLPDVGLSPHGRGNPRASLTWCASPGPIPAWAGEPSCRAILMAFIRAYPRMGGGTCGRSTRNGAIPGLSPHGRGNPMA